MVMKKKIVIVGSKVHNVGYRYFLMENALAFGIEKFGAINVVRDKQVIEVYVEGDDEAINRFCEFVKSNFPPDAKVDEIKIEDYTGYVPKLETFALVYYVGLIGKFIEYGRQIITK